MTAAWLDPVRAALDESPVPFPMFFRDDDAGWDDAGLLGLLDVFGRYGVAADVAVIPNAVTPRLVRALCACAGAGSVRLLQHGFAHVNHEASGRKHEFGPSLGASEQQALLAQGQLLLQDAFGDLVQPVFTPPWNRCTEETADALVARGFTVLSRDHTAPRLDRDDLVEVPVTVDWFGHRKGIRWSRDELAHSLARNVRDGGQVGVMLHHAISDGVERAGIGELLALVSGHARARMSGILELATQGVSRAA